MSVKVLFEPELTQVLDHGYVQFVQSWGSDERIIEAARMSTDKGFLGWGPFCPDCNEPVVLGEPRCAKCGSASTRKPGDEKLLRYLYAHKHMTPFEMAGMTIEVQAPIFVFREWHRHRTQSYNEMSGRYVQLPKLCYVPSNARIIAGRQGTANKQSSETFPETANDALIVAVQNSIIVNYEDAYKAYEGMLKLGVAREIARSVLPVGQYSRMRAQANLRNWLAFLALRMDAGAQWEIRQYAEVVYGFLYALFPRTMRLFDEERSVGSK